MKHLFKILLFISIIIFFLIIGISFYKKTVLPTSETPELVKEYQNAVQDVYEIYPNSVSDFFITDQEYEAVLDDLKKSLKDTVRDSDRSRALSDFKFVLDTRSPGQKRNKILLKVFRRLIASSDEPDPSSIRLKSSEYVKRLECIKTERDRLLHGISFKTWLQFSLLGCPSPVEMHKEWEETY